MDARCIARFLVMLFYMLNLSKESYCDAVEISTEKPKVCTSSPTATTTTTAPPPTCPPKTPTPGVADPKLLPNITADAQETTVTTISTNAPTTTISSTNAFSTSTTTKMTDVLETSEPPFEQFDNGADRIVGGTLVDITEVPFQASLQKSGSHICGACIISENYLITAAHCNLGNASIMRVRVGSSLRTSGGRLVPVAEMISHPKYEVGKADYDFCVIRLKFDLAFTPYCQPIKMIEKDGELSNDSFVSVQGWGLIDENGPISLPLLQITVPVISTAVCKNVYGNKTITSRMFCAGDLSGNKDSCQGDSGGPAVCEGLLVGIVSWGYGCARAGYPGVYSKIANQRDWITNVTGNVASEPNSELELQPTRGSRFNVFVTSRVTANKKSTKPKKEIAAEN